MKSISFITIVLISYLTSTLFAQQCNNLLLKYFGFQSLNSPQSGTDLPYCNHLKTAQTCCSAETVATFQARADQIADKLNNYHAARDLFLAQLSHRYYKRVVQMLEDITNNHMDDLREIQSTNPALGDQLQAEIQFSIKVRDAASHFQFNNPSYQDYRTNCFTVAMQVRAEAWCLACDPNYQNEGLNADGSVLFSDLQCQFITDACWEYFYVSAQFNVLFEIPEVYWKLLVLSKYLDGEESNLNRMDPYKAISTQLPVIVPQRWTSGDGNCWDLWSRDNLLVELLTFNSSVLLSTEQAAIIAELEEEQRQIEEEEVVYNNNNIEFSGSREDGFEFEFEFEGRMLFERRMLFGVLDLIHEGASDPGLKYNVLSDPGYLTDLSSLFGY